MRVVCVRLEIYSQKIFLRSDFRGWVRKDDDKKYPKQKKCQKFKVNDNEFFKLQPQDFSNIQQNYKKPEPKKP
jgi:hypothetical protein